MTVITRRRSQKENANSLEEIDKDSLFVENFIKQISALHQIYMCPIEKTIYFNGKALNLGGQNKIFRLFYSLYLHQNEGLGRDKLIEQVYQISKKELSTRQQESYHHNIVKLISRSRKIAQKELGSLSFPVEWFSHQYGSRKWFLFKSNIKLPKLL